MAIWKKKVTKAELDGYYSRYMVKYIGIEITEMTDNTLVGRMPVDERTKQPMGILNGGASCVLAESLASIAGNLCIEGEDDIAVGLSLTAQHLRSVASGYVYGEARPVKLGRTIQVWEIDIKDDKGELCCKVQCPLMVRRKLAQ